MDFCIIPPLSNLNLMNQGKRIFALGQLILRHEQYAEFIDQKIKDKWFVILDCGTGDHNDVITNDMLLDITEALMPSEVIPVDILFNKQATIDSCKEFVDKFEQRGLLGKVQIMFCPQGNTVDEWLEAYQFGLDNSYIDTIGMSKLSVPHAWLGKWDNDQNIMQARHKCYDFLLQNDLIKKPFHFLGAGNVIEFSHYRHELARSTDSCFSVLAAINNINWMTGQTHIRIPTPKNYFTDLLLKDEQIGIFRDNVEVLASMCSR